MIYLIVSGVIISLISVAVSCVIFLRIGSRLDNYSDMARSLTTELEKFRSRIDVLEAARNERSGIIDQFSTDITKLKHLAAGYDGDITVLRDQITKAINKMASQANRDKKKEAPTDLEKTALSDNEWEDLRQKFILPEVENMTKVTPKARKFGERP